MAAGKELVVDVALTVDETVFVREIPGVRVIVLDTRLVIVTFGLLRVIETDALCVLEFLVDTLGVLVCTIELDTRTEAVGVLVCRIVGVPVGLSVLVLELACVRVPHEDAVLVFEELILEVPVLVFIFVKEIFALFE